MRNIPIIFLLIGSIFDFVGCKEKSNNTVATPAAAKPTATQAAAAAPPSLPSITIDEMRRLFDKCDYIDFIFYNMDFSMSVNDKSNVQRVINFVDKTQPAGNLTCPAMGRLVFQGNGEILLEADMHYDKTCQHFIFYKDGKKTYANNISQQGIQYFQQMFAQVRVAPK